MFTVVVTEKGGTQKRLEFDEEVISVGRVQGNQIVLPRGNVSKRHSKIELKNGAFLLADMGSTNGTYINGRRITESTRVRLGDKIYIGDFILSLEDHEGLGAAPEPPPAPKEGARPSIDDVATSAPLRPVTGKTGPVALPKKEHAFGPPTKPPSTPSPPAKPPSTPSPPAKPPSTPPGAVSPPPKPKHPDDTEVSVSSSSKPPRPAKITVSKVSGAPPPPPPGRSPAAKDASGAPAAFQDKEEIEALTDILLDQVARQIKRVNRASAPTRLDGGTAGKVRIVIDELVDDLTARGKLPPTVDADVLKGRVFRAAVDLGPLSHWLDNPEIEVIRVTRPDSIRLFRAGGWKEATSGFVSAEGLAEIIRCLAAGLEVAEGGGPGISKFRLEEGFLAFAALAPGSLTGPALIIDKTTGKGEDITRSFEKDLAAELERALANRSRIAVVGASLPSRLAIIGDILGMISEENFVVSVEDLPLMTRSGRTMMRLCSRGRRPGSSEPSGIQKLLFHALELEPDWLVVSGGGWRDVPGVLSASSTRQGVIAEMPLAAGSQTDHGLAVTMAAAGAGISDRHATELLCAAFDIILTVRRQGGSSAVVEKVSSCGVSTDGSWSPTALYERKKP